jgi:RimJ/RimL family protein N-acetyltransferase
MTPERAPLRTARLLLEPIGPEHAEAMWTATETSLEELSRWMLWAVDTTREGTETFAAEAEREWKEGAGFHFAILRDGDLAGALGLEVRAPINRIGEIGYWIRSDLAGRGLVTEAAEAVVAFGFEVLGLYRLELRAGVGNGASQRVAEKLGFRREGTLRKGCPGGPEPYDCYLYGLLLEDFLASEEARGSPGYL